MNCTIRFLTRRHAIELELMHRITALGVPAQLGNRTAPKLRIRSELREHRPKTRIGRRLGAQTDARKSRALATPAGHMQISSIAPVRPFGIGKNGFCSSRALLPISSGTRFVPNLLETPAKSGESGYDVCRRRRALRRGRGRLHARAVPLSFQMSADCRGSPRIFASASVSLPTPAFAIVSARPFVRRRPTSADQRPVRFR